MDLVIASMATMASSVRRPVQAAAVARMESARKMVLVNVSQALLALIVV